jgi:hypothetical protein
MVSRLILAFAMLFMTAPTTKAQEANYDEAKIPKFVLPDPLTFSNGAPVETEKDWTNKRRPEILKHFKDHVYGTMPDPPPRNKRVKFITVKQTEIEISVEPDSNETIKTRLKEVKIFLGDDPDSPVANLLIFLPVEPIAACPVFLGYNFSGNHTIHPTKEISINRVWNRGKTSVMPNEQTRGTKSSRWPVGMIVFRGYALATLYYGDVDPDFDDGFKNGVHTLFPGLQNRPDNWTSIGAWAWALHRVMDYFENDGDINGSHVALLGHSRLGKTALWSGATDERFAVVISNNSGCGGAALARRQYGETVAQINKVFPHWFCERHKKYGNNEDELPVDQHMLVSLIAPRPVYIASAIEDRWADPKGEFLSAFHASTVYKLFGKTGLAIDNPEMPAVNSPIGDTIGYHVRSGKHDVTRYDWLQYINFARRHFQSIQ